MRSLAESHIVSKCCNATWPGQVVTIRDRNKWLGEATDAEIDHCQNPYLKLRKSIKSWSFSSIQGDLTGGPGGWANRPFNPICCTAANFVRCSRINGKLAC